MAEYLSKEELEDYFGREYLTIYEMFGFSEDDYIQHYYRDEIWTRIIGFEKYWISNKGRVWSEKRQIMLRRYVDSSMHWYVTLFDKSKRYYPEIHRLLGIHFIPNPNNYPMIGHINDNKNNNCINNLEWCTYSKNMHRAYENECRKKPYKPVIAKNTNTGEARYFTSMLRLGDYLGMNHYSHITRSIETGWRVNGHRVFDAKDFNLPPGLQDGDVIDLEVLYEN